MALSPPCPPPCATPDDPASAIELGFRVFEAGRADAVGKRRVGVFRHVHLHALPVVTVVADPLAIGADRQQSAKAPDVVERGLQLCNLLSQARLE